MATITKIETSSIVELYTAYFNRVSDNGGLTHWMERYNSIKESSTTTIIDADTAGAGALLQVAQEMTTEEEYTSQYTTSSTNESFLSTIYQNILNRGIDSAGLTFWSNHLEKGSFTRSEAIVKIIDGAKSNTTEAGKLDAALLANKSAVSEHFALALKSDDPKLAAEAFAKVTSDPASVQTAINNINNSINIGRDNIDIGGNQHVIGDGSNGRDEVNVGRDYKITGGDDNGIQAGGDVNTGTQVGGDLVGRDKTQISIKDSFNPTTTNNVNLTNINDSNKSFDFSSLNNDTFTNIDQTVNDLDLVGINTFDTGAII